MTIRQLLARALILAAALGAGGCQEDLCKEAVPSFEVKLELAEGVKASTLAALEAQISFADLQRTAPLDISRLRARGEATFLVMVGEAGAEGFRITVRVEALDSSGLVVGSGASVFDGVGDGCNFFALRLAPNAR